MTMEKEAFLDQLRKELSNYKEVEYNQQEQTFIIELFNFVIYKKEKGESDKMARRFVEIEMGKRRRSRQLAKGFFYLTGKAQGKYNAIEDFLKTFDSLDEFLNSFDQTDVQEPQQ